MSEGTIRKRAGRPVRGATLDAGAVMAAITREGSAAAAARALGVTQQAVWHWQARANGRCVACGEPAGGARCIPCRRAVQAAKAARLAGARS